MEASKILSGFISKRSQKRKADPRLSNHPSRMELRDIILKTKKQLASTETAVKRWKTLHAKAFKQLTKTDVYDQLMGSLEKHTKTVRLSEARLKNLILEQNILPSKITNGNNPQTSTTNSNNDPQTSTQNTQVDPATLTTNSNDDPQTSTNDVTAETTNPMVTVKRAATGDEEEDSQNQSLPKRPKSNFWSYFGLC